MPVAVSTAILVSIAVAGLLVYFKKYRRRESKMLGE
jgi:hypothetical protein